jgi:DNA-binding transcriptional ArsR family regulator
MLNHQKLEQILRALAEPTRFLIVERLSRSPASVSGIAEPFDMSLAAIVQHLQVLEAAGIVTSEKVGRVRTYRLEPGGMDGLALWIEARRHPSERRLDRLGAYLADANEETRSGNKEDKQT